MVSTNYKNKLKITAYVAWVIYKISYWNN